MRLHVHELIFRDMGQTLGSSETCASGAHWYAPCKAFGPLAPFGTSASLVIDVGTWHDCAGPSSMLPLHASSAHHRSMARIRV